MKFAKFSTVAAILALATFSLAGCSKDDETVPTPKTGEFTLHMANSVGTVPLVLSTTTYKNAHGDDFTVGKLLYYISNVQLRKADGSTYAVPNSYFLVNQADEDSQDLTMKDVPEGDYTAVSFLAGVDSTRTKAGNLTGILDTNHDMWWAWSNEFINFKLEGTSPQAPTGALVFHVAGYKGANGANSTTRVVTLPFPTTNLLVRDGHTPEVHITADVAKAFTGPNQVDFATSYNVMMAPASLKIADNIAAGMFKVAHIHAN